tara:strand:- start:152 stop:595 length:444 start_codon:yes stop_codon:yes gene_type:complete
VWIARAAAGLEAERDRRSAMSDTERHAALTRRLLLTTSEGRTSERDPLVVANTLAGMRDDIRACMVDEDGFAAIRDAVHPDGGTGSLRTEFDIDATGIVEPMSVATDPPLPPRFTRCLVQALAGNRFDGAAETTRVTLRYQPSRIPE